MESETVFQNLFEVKTKVSTSYSHPYYPRIYDVQLPCQWLEHCYGGKCPAFTRINGNYYCAKKSIH